MGNNYEVETTVGIHTGISLEKEGFLLDRNGHHYRSLFLNVPNPVTVSETCSIICGNVQDIIHDKARDLQKSCSSIFATAKNEMAVIPRIDIAMNGVVRDCLHMCLHHTNCMHAGIKGSMCIIRSRGLDLSETIVGSSEEAEFNLACLFGKDNKEETCEILAKRDEPGGTNCSSNWTKD